MRNYVLSNTTGVFEGSYQPKRVREDLTRLAFGPRAGHNDSLFRRLRNMSLSRDAGAPTEIGQEDLQKFEQRNDVKALRASLETASRAGDDTAKKTIKLQL